MKYYIDRNLGHFCLNWIRDIFLPDKTAKTLDSFFELPNGWNSGEEIKPSEIVIYRAKHLLYYIKFNGFPYKSVAFPGDDNSIILGFINKDIYISIVITEDSFEDLSVEKGYGYDFNIEEKIESPTLNNLINFLTKYNP